MVWERWGAQLGSTFGGMQQQDRRSIGPLAGLVSEVGVAEDFGDSGLGTVLHHDYRCKNDSVDAVLYLLGLLSIHVHGKHW